MSKTLKPAAAPAKPWGPGTICIQSGYRPKVGEPRILPIFQSTTYKYEDLEQVERLFALKEKGYKYTRTGNPTLAAFEQKITELELFNDLTVDRELKMIELKKEINGLLRAAGRPEKYKIAGE